MQRQQRIPQPLVAHAMHACMNSHHPFKSQHNGSTVHGNAFVHSYPTHQGLEVMSLSHADVS